MRNSQSKDGELFQKQTEVIDRIPKGEVTPEDLKQVLDFFDLIAFNKFITMFGDGVKVTSKMFKIGEIA